MDTSDPKTHRQLKQRQKLAETERSLTIKAVMASKGGRAWIYDMLSRAHIFSSSIGQTPYLTYFAEGERNQGLQLLVACGYRDPELLAEVEAASPELMTQMLQERQDVNWIVRRTKDGNVSDAYDGADGGDEAGGESA